MKFIRKIRREQEQKARKQMLQEKRNQGLKPEYEYDPATRKYDVKWVPVKMPIIGHNTRRAALLERRKITKTI